MTKKIQKLKEVNLQLTNVLTELETLMFVRNIDSTSTKKQIKEEQPNVVLNIK